MTTTGHCSVSSPFISHGSEVPLSTSMILSKDLDDDIDMLSESGEEDAIIGKLSMLFRLLFFVHIDCFRLLKGSLLWLPKSIHFI